MIKKSIYPKTNRICNNEITYEITEKIDGSNLVFAKLNGKLLICQRNYILTREELDKHNAYGGLIGWLDEYGDTLLNLLNEKSAICGEWIAFGKIKYDFKNRFQMFAKANITEEYDLKNVIYKREYFKYPFENQIFPEFIDIVPLVSILNTSPSIEDLDILLELCDRIVVLNKGKVAAILDARTTNKEEVGLLMTKSGKESEENEQKLTTCK